MRLIQCEQGTEAWFNARIGVVTASNFKIATERLTRKSGNRVAGERSANSENYAFKKAVERISGELTEDVFQTWAMKRGNELEAAARELYSIRHGVEVVESGIALTNCGYFGYSTDGLVSHDGAIEIKSLVSAKSILPVLNGDLSEFTDQMQGGLHVMDREWCDFVLYMPQLRKINQHLFVKRVYRDDAYIKQLKQDLDDFNDLIWEIVNTLASYTQEALPCQ